MFLGAIIAEVGFLAFVAIGGGDLDVFMAEGGSVVLLFLAVLGGAIGAIVGLALAQRRNSPPASQ
jgi:hypothetical protein